MNQTLQRPASIFRNPSFNLLFLAQIISLTGSGVTTVGLALFAHQLVGGGSAAAVIGNALMLRIVAFLLFSQIAGVLADRLNRKTILIVADVVRFVLMLLFPFITSIWQIYLMIFLINSATAFFSPTYDATLPDIAGRNHYVKALSLSRLATDLEAVFAPALAGILVAMMGLSWLFWFDALTYLISALLVTFTRISSTPKPTLNFSFKEFLGELTVGTRILVKESALRCALLLSFVEAVAGAAAIVATVVYVRDVLGFGETVFAAVMAGLGLGSALTSVSLGWLTGRYESVVSDPAKLHGRRHRWAEKAMSMGGLVLGLLLIPGVLQPHLMIFIVLWFLNGAGQALIAIPSSTLLAEHTLEANRGKAYAAYFALTHAFWLITYPAIGQGVSRIGPPLTFTLAGGVCLVIVIVALIMRRPQFDHVHEP